MANRNKKKDDFKYKGSSKGFKKDSAIGSDGYLTSDAIERQSKGDTNAYRDKIHGKLDKNFDPRKVKFDDYHKRKSPDIRTNHPSWYASNPQLLRDVASLPYGYMLGNKLTTTGELFATDGPGIASEDIYVPGILSMTYIPTLGCGNTATDAPTVAARNIYSFVRHANSGSANYEAPDLMLMIMARSQAEVWLNEVERAYGLCKLFSTRNRYYAETIVEATGFNYKDIIMHLNDMRAYINLAKSRLNTIKIPAGMPAVDRWNWLASNVFVDDDNSTPQSYVFKARGFYKYSGFTAETGTELKFKPKMPGGPDNSLMSFDDIVSYTEDLIAPLVSDEDVGIMSGDIIKAYGNNLRTLTLTSEDYVVVPLFNEDALNQINNATIFNLSPIEHTTRESLIDIRQENGVIINSVTLQGEVGDQDPMVYPRTTLLNINSENPTPEVTIVATRLSINDATITGTSNNARMIQINSAGSEVIIDARIWNRPAGDAVAATPQIGTLMHVDDYAYVLPITAFRRHPQVWMYRYSENDATIEMLRPLTEFDTVTTVDQEVLSRMHKQAVLNEFNVTSNTTFD